MDIKGKLIEKFETAQISSTFRKREFVVEYADNPQYPEFLKFELTQDRCEQLDPMQPGQEIQIFFNLKGRKWTDPKGEVKYFNSLQAWKLERINDIENSTAPAPQDNAALENQKEPDWLQSEGDDDLPF